MLTVFRAIFLISAVLCISDAILIPMSHVVADRAPGSADFLPLSLGVSATLVGVSSLLLGVRHWFLKLTRLTCELEDDLAEVARRHLFGMQVCLTLLGAGFSTILAALTYAILERIGGGSAVFG